MAIHSIGCGLVLACFGHLVVMERKNKALTFLSLASQESLPAHLTKLALKWVEGDRSPLLCREDLYTGEEGYSSGRG